VNVELEDERDVNVCKVWWKVGEASVRTKRVTVVGVAGSEEAS